MNRVIFFLLVFFSLAVSGCCKTKRATVVRDCTGTYLRIGEKDYRVCNTEKTADYQDGEEVAASFKETRSCTGPANDQIQCMMYHEYESWIEVKKIK